MPDYAPSEVLVAMRCGACGVWFGMTEFFQEKRQGDGQTWYCPNGHPRVFSDTDRDKLARERQAHSATKSLLRAEERSHAATRGNLTKHKKRSAAGVCPCCNRTFQQLARHMKGQHPNFVKASK